MAPKKRPVPLNINITPIGEGQATSNTIDAASEWVALSWLEILVSCFRDDVVSVSRCSFDTSPLCRTSELLDVAVLSVLCLYEAPAEPAVSS